MNNNVKIKILQEFINSRVILEDDTFLWEISDKYSIPLDAVKEILTGKDETPEPIENPDYSFLIDTCKAYVEEVKNGVSDSDTRHYIFEAAIGAIYGKDFWKWNNSRM